MNRNRGDITHRLHIPDFPEKLFLRKYPVWILRQESQKIKLLGRKRRLLTIDPHTPGRLIDLNTTDLDHIIGRNTACGQPLIAIKVSLDSGNKIAGTE